MKKQTTVTTADKRKIIFVSVLYLTAMIIIFLGMFFTVFSLVNNISFKFLSSSVPGFVFGLLVLYLGIRYYLSLGKLKEEVFKSSSKFSWNNFKKRRSKKLVFKK